MSLDAAIAELVTAIGAIDGIKFAPDQPPETSIAFPFAIVYPASGEYEHAPLLDFKELHTIIIEVHFNRSVLSLAVKEMTPFITLIANALKADPTLDGTVSTIIAEANNRIAYSILFTDYAGMDTIAIQFRVPVKIQE